MLRSAIILKATLILAVLLPATGGVVAQPQAGDWVTFAPENEGFSVLLPEKPEFKTASDAKTGNTYETRMYSALEKKSGLFFMVVMQHTATMAGALSPSERIDRFMKGFERGIQESMTDKKILFTRERDLELKGNYGRQYSMSLGDARGVVRTYYVGNTVYVLVAMGGQEATPGVSRFLNSFKVKATAAPAATTRGL